MSGEGGTFNGLVCHQLCGLERAEHLTVWCVISCVGGEGGAFLQFAVSSIVWVERAGPLTVWCVISFVGA